MTGYWHYDEYSNLDRGSTEAFFATCSGRFWNPTSLLSGRYRRLSLEMRSQECGAFDLPPSGTEVDNAWSYASPPQYIFIAWCVIGTFTTLRLYHNNCKFWYTFNSILERFFFCKASYLHSLQNRSIQTSSETQFYTSVRNLHSALDVISFVDGPNPPYASNGRTISCEYILWRVCKEKLQICPRQLHNGCPSVRLSANKT